MIGALCLISVLGGSALAAPAGPKGTAQATKPADGAKPAKSEAEKKPLDCGAMWCRVFSTPAEAFSVVLESKPLVLGVGEYHETNGSAPVRSSMSWFTSALLPRLEHKASDLIAETWISEGNCGDEETKAVEEIGEVTQRPEETEDELVVLLKGAKAHGIMPHVLQVSCAQYRTLLDDKKELDPEKLLELVAKLLLDQARTLHERNQEHGSKRTVVIYGGAIHNDVVPKKDYAAYAFGPAMDAATDGRYVELDLFVPELIQGDEDERKEAWFPYFERYANASRVLLFRPRPSSYVLILPRGAKKQER